MSKRPRHNPSGSPSSPSPPLSSSPPSKYTRSVSPPPQTMTTSTATTAGTTTINSSGGGGGSSSSSITCTLPSCPQRIHQTTESFETHYAKFHINRCHDCLRNFPTARILECHIRENHDMFAVLKREKGEKIYACFVEDCEKVCKSPGKRRAHLVDKHYYHKNFNFDIVNTGIDRATSLLTSSPHRKSRTRVRRVSEASNPASGTTATSTTTTTSIPQGKLVAGKKPEENGMDIDRADDTSKAHPKKHTRSASEPSITTTSSSTLSKDAEAGVTKGGTVDEDTDMTDLASRMSAIRFVPPSVVRFGRRGGGFAKK